MQATQRKELREKAQKRTLKNYYATLNIRSQFEQLGNTAMVADCERIMGICLERLRILRFQEILKWPLLVLPAPGMN